MKKIVIGLIVVVAGLGAYRFTSKSVELGKDSHELSSIPQLQEIASDSPSDPYAGKEETIGSLDNSEAQMVEKLRNDYGEHIASLSVQAALIKVKRRFLEQFPEDGEERFRRIVLEAFPQWASSIFRIIEGLEIYQSWLEEQHLALQELSPMARNGALWEKRREIFGDDAELIWKDEKHDLAQGKLRMQEVFHELDQAHDIGLDEKLYQLRLAIDENLIGTAQDLAVSESVISRAFFNLNSVQEDLAVLPPEARQVEIDNIRRQLGFTDDQIESLAAKDQERELRWQNGLAYMEERQSLIAQLEGPSLEEALQGLRVKYFKHEARTIQKEEAMDFWRFKRARKYGNN